ASASRGCHNCLIACRFASRPIETDECVHQRRAEITEGAIGGGDGAVNLLVRPRRASHKHRSAFSWIGIVRLNPLQPCKSWRRQNKPGPRRDRAIPSWNGCVVSHERVVWRQIPARVIATHQSDGMSMSIDSQANDRRIACPTSQCIGSDCEGSAESMTRSLASEPY
ncbi:hypothetical protein KR51_00017500, partial [Rubidibacter lacunae KORDI 51-2]